MDTGSIIGKLILVAQAAIPVIAPSPGGDDAIALGKAVIGLVDEVRSTLGGEGDVPELVETRDALEKRVNQEIGETVDRLRGD
jgi:hypothetical protein